MAAMAAVPTDLLALAQVKMARMHGLVFAPNLICSSSVSSLTKYFCKSPERVNIFTVVINDIYVNTDKLHILLFKTEIFCSLVGPVFPATEGTRGTQPAATFWGFFSCMQRQNQRTKATIALCPQLDTTSN